MKQKPDRAFFLRWGKRILIYCLGLYLMAIGVVFSSASGLGVSPVGALANVLYLIGAAENAPSFVTLGNCTIAVYCLYILVEFLLLRRDFKPEMLLQLAASILFGKLVDLAKLMLAFLPAPQGYVMQMLYLLCSIPLVAAGVMLYLSPSILPTPGEGMSLAISKKTGLSLGSSKTVFDCSLVVLSALTSFIYFHGLVGVREGTVICALLVGFVMRQFMRIAEAPLMRFVERETKLRKAMDSGVPFLDASGKPKLLVCIGWEFGSGGYELAKALAQRLGIPFYSNDELIPLEAAESGLPESFIHKHEHMMAHSIVYDFMNAGYTMHMELTPLERLFAAQVRVIRRIAAKNESAVLVGRCSDYTLHDDPNSFRIFVHAPMDYRVSRIAETMGLSREQAAADLATTDASRARYYEHFTGHAWGSTQYYNLAVDTHAFGMEKSLDVIDSAIRCWCEQRELDYEKLKKGE